MEISCVIITKNEEKNIEKCIRSVLPVVNEVVVIDSLSTDRTKEICTGLGARFIEHEWEGMIEQKNWAVKQAKYPYILSMDADEVLSDRLAASIMEVKKNWTHDGYYFNRLTNYCGKWIKHCGWYPDKKLRLWDRRKGKFTGFNPHDRYQMEEGATLKYLKGDLLHYSYRDINQHINQANHFADVGAKTAFINGKNSNIFLILFKPTWKFFKDYILKLGFLDGYYGLVISIISAQATFLKYIRLKEKYNSDTA
ncbi:MAG: glycosyltransferase family 2 protein [Bacteroidales bacterium]|nr:glycosyltransferase family 2 protein [Bacteroidales bacterium]